MKSFRKYIGWSRVLFQTSRVVRRSERSSSSLRFEPLEDRRLLSLSVPALNSQPGAVQSLYLDFDGSAPFSWFNATGSDVLRGHS